MSTVRRLINLMEARVAEPQMGAATRKDVVGPPVLFCVWSTDESSPSTPASSYQTPASSFQVQLMLQPESEANPSGGEHLHEERESPRTETLTSASLHQCIHDSDNDSQASSPPAHPRGRRLNSRTEFSLEIEEDDAESYLGMFHILPDILDALGYAADNEDSFRLGADTENAEDAFGLGGEGECPICADPFESEAGPKRSHWCCVGGCRSRVCVDCMKTYIEMKVMNGQQEISCMECSHPVDDSDIAKCVGTEMMEKKQMFQLMKGNNNLRVCPKCGVLNEGSAFEPDMACIACDTKFCYHHDLQHGDKPCTQKKVQKVGLANHLAFLKMVKCPKCATRVERNGGCAHMKCRCGEHFCWHCGNTLTGVNMSEHWKYSCRGSKMIAARVGKAVGITVGAPIALGLGVAAVGVVVGTALIWYPIKVYVKRR